MANNNPFKVSALAVAIAAAGAATPVYALYDYEEGDFRINLDTTVTVGAAWRADDRDYRGVGDVNAAAAQAAGDNPSGAHHLHGTSSQDNSNLLWKKGSTYSEVIKLTADLEINYKNFGAFIRGKTYYDNRIINGDGVTDKPEYYRQNGNGDPFEPAQSQGTGGDILDAFVWGDFNINDMPLNVRLGRQVINWGEGVLFSNGINTINPIDVNAFLTPGSEVKDALIPLAAAYASLGITESFSLEGFVLLEWKETELPGCGTYFSTTDLAGPNCWGGFYAGGNEATGPNADLAVLPRGADQEADDNGQYGVAARYFADSIETEFGLYFINYHSQAPIISGHMPVPSEISTPPFDSVANFAPLVYGGRTIDELTLAEVRQLAQNLANANDPTAGTNVGARLLPAGDFIIEYPEDIQLFGASFNTTMNLGLPGGDTSVAGEISMRKDQPFQLEDGDTLGGAIGLPSISCHDAPTPYDCYTKYEPGEYAPGYITEDYYQAEIAFIHFFDQILGASRWTAVVDIAGSYVDLPSKDEALLNSSYNATLNHPWVPDAPVFVNYGGGSPLDITNDITVPYATWLAGAWAAGSNTAYPENSEFYPTSGAWGYKMRFTGDYPNVFAGVNLRPTISFSHDVDGTTPGPITNFLENRKALGLSLEAEYLNTYVVNVGYTDFYGAEPYNQLADRDFYSLSMSASF